MKGTLLHKKMNKLICLVGETARGKDTAARYLQEIHQLKPVISYTTRPKRKKEIDGREHHFINKAKAKEMLDAGGICAYTKIGDYQYFATKDELNNADFYIIDPNGIEYLKQVYDDKDLFIIYITCDKTLAEARYISRGGSYSEYIDRASAEEQQFYRFSHDFKYDIKIENNNTLEGFYRKLDFILLMDCLK